MDRDQRLKRLVLSCICDDYENVDQTILEDVSALGARIGWSVERCEIVQALAELLTDGHAKAYILSPRPPHVTELAEMPGMDTIEAEFEQQRTYFLATKQGIDLQTSDDSWWPPEFEDEPA